MAMDIGEILFVEILKMTEYPGGIFSSHTIMESLILYFLVPTVFIIIFIYITVGRFFGHQKIRLVLSITIYLFIVVSGFYAGFAHLAGPYIIFLIVIGGILFLYSHFGMRREGGGGQTHHLTGAAVAQDTGETIREALHEYEVLARYYEEGERNLRDLEERSKDNPALHREVEVQKQAVLDTKKRLVELEIKIKKQKLGREIELTIKEMRSKLGF